MWAWLELGIKSLGLGSGPGRGGGGNKEHVGVDGTGDKERGGVVKEAKIASSVYKCTCYSLLKSLPCPYSELATCPSTHKRTRL